MAFGPRARVTLVVAAYVGVGLLTARAARRSWNSVVDYAPPYRFSDAAVPPTTPLAGRVVLVVVDGLRLDASHELPTVNRLRAEGADYECRAGIPSFSRPARATLATGAWSSLHGATTNFHRKTVALDNLFRQARRAGIRPAVAGAGLWRSLFAPDLEGAEVVEPQFEEQPGGFRAHEAGLREFGRQSVELLRAEPAPRLSVIDLLDPDDAAHDFGTGSEDYRRAARAVDGRIEEILRSLDLTTTAVVVVSDHGHLAAGGHGGGEAEVLRTPLVLAGCGVRRGIQGAARQIDVAPTLAALLGLPIPAASQGRVLLEALDVDDPRRLELLRAQDRQKTAFARSYAASLGAEPPATAAPERSAAALAAAIDALDRQVDEAASARRRADRPARLLPLLAAIAIPFFPSATAARRRRWAGLTAVVVGVAVTFTAFLLLRAAAGVQLSLSSINHEEHLPGYFQTILVLTVAALVAGLLASFALARRSAPDTVTLCRLGLIVVGGAVSVLAVLTAAFHWDHGLLLEWQLADIDNLFVNFVRLVQLQGIAFGAVLVPPLAWGFRRLATPKGTGP